MSGFRYYPGAKAAIDRSVAAALTATAEDVVRDVEQRGVVPHAEEARVEGHEAGRLASSVEAVPAKSTRARIVWDAPFAARAYFHPEWEFSQAVHGGAKGRWMDDYIDGERTDFVRSRYRRNLGRTGAFR